MNDELEHDERPDAESHDEDSETEVPDLARQMEELQKKNGEYLDRLKRLQAEFENYRKRAAKEREEYIQFASAKLVKELLGLLDNFGRAMANTENARNGRALDRGVKMMHDQLKDILKREGVTEIDTSCKSLDPFQHEVLSRVVDPTREDNEIIECVQKGYKMKGRVIRPAGVIVSRRTEPTKSESMNQDEDNQGSPSNHKDDVKRDRDEEVS